MSLADYGMLRLASTNLIDAKKRVRNLTRWFSKQIKAVQIEFDNAKQAKRAMMQQIQGSIFNYSQPLYAEMAKAQQKPDGQTEVMNLQYMLNQRNQMAQMYIAQYDEYLNDILHKYEDAIDELEADKKQEMEDANNDVTYWQEVKKQYAQNYQEGVKEMWGNRA